MILATNEKMQPSAPELIISEYLSFLKLKEFPCIAAKAALARQQVKCLVVSHMACPHEDTEILAFLYKFIDDYRGSEEMYHSAAIIFSQPAFLTEDAFEELFWQRLQSISNLDAARYGYDKRVDSAPSSPGFSFSLKEEAFFIIGLHPGSTRATRQFKYPTMVFNPHLQFEQLRQTAKFEGLKYAVRKRDIAYSGSINPMLEDYGAASEVYQYSGRKYDDQWQCPLKINHAQPEHNTAP